MKTLEKGLEEKLPKDVIMSVFENRDEIQQEKIEPNELIEELSKSNKRRQPIESNFFESADNVPDPKELSPEHIDLMIFDDLLLQKQKKCEAYYVRGRHSNCDCCICHKTILNYHDKQSEKTQTFLFLSSRPEKH